MTRSFPPTLGAPRLPRCTPAGTPASFRAPAASASDTPAADAMERCARLAVRLLAAPTSLVSTLEHGALVPACSHGAHVALAHVGALPAALAAFHVTPRHPRTAAVVVSDARVHPATRDDALVRDLGVVAYLGVPILGRAGAPLGALAVLDCQPRAWTGADVDALAQLAAAVATELELRLALADEVTARRRLEEQLAYQAHHDALTGLPNGVQLRARVSRALERANEQGLAADRVALVLLDLDGFKLVNDSADHAAGDMLLHMVAERLLAATYGRAFVARLGGDEFGVLVEDVRTDADAIALADELADALGEPFLVRGASLVVGASIGIARGVNAASPMETLFRDADLALHEAKGRGRGQHALFEPALHAAALERVSLEGALRRGLSRGELRVVYQPIIALATGRVAGVEALVRWAHPERGEVPPSTFIPLAEETGLIVPLGRWVLEEACRQGVRWAARHGGRAGGAPFGVGVNVSGRQLQQASFLADVEGALRASGLPPECLTLELTETTVIRHQDTALERLSALRALGVRLAIDDFGTGYSALGYLRSFPFDVLKIDKSFVERVAEGARDAALASAIVGLSGALSLRTVAEGVETAAQRDALLGIGCELGQGYLFARPLPAPALEALLEG